MSPRATSATDFAALMKPWTRRWGLPGLEQGIQARYSRLLHRSLGRCWPERGEIALHPALQQASAREVAMVLCHEAAHVAAYQLLGRMARPHGPEWAALVEVAGFRATLREALDVSSIAGARRRSARASRRLVVHRCPVCQTERTAKRVVPGWRCAECVAAGLDGRFETFVRARERG